MAKNKKNKGQNKNNKGQNKNKQNLQLSQQVIKGGVAGVSQWFFHWMMDNFPFS